MKKLRYLFKSSFVTQEGFFCENYYSDTRNTVLRVQQLVWLDNKGRASGPVFLKDRA